MCNCVAELEEKIKNHLVDLGRYRKPIKSVRMQGKGLNFADGLNKLVSNTSTSFEVELDGQKKKILCPVIHQFCPFCGTSKNEGGE